MARKRIGYHDRGVERRAWHGHHEPATKFTYTFYNFFHPYVGQLISKVNKSTSLSGVMDATWQSGLRTDFFDALYNPTQDDVTHVNYFPKEIDVEEHGPYAGYNWELFFHIPLLVAVHLSKTRRFAEAQRWFHFIFDPTETKPANDPRRFWKFLAFRQGDDPKQIDRLLELLSKTSGLTAEEQDLQKDILDGYHAMLEKPFQPHAVARTRHVAYQYSVVMKYLDNLIAWGDDLFQRDTIETINEATLLYVQAAGLLGPRPEKIPPTGTVQAKSYRQLKDSATLDAMGNAMVELEAAFPFNAASSGSAGSGGSPGTGPLFGIARTLYFCIPKNDKLLGYWDTVADRLFKIRHCMNIEGVVRPLALFDPPIDPGMLVAAAAAGLDVNGIVSGLNQRIGPTRCHTLIQKSLELSAEVRSLGGALLSALEKGDAEHLALVRQRQELQIQQMTQDLRFLQWKNAEESTQSLLTSRATVLQRLRHYQRLLGLPSDPNAPETVALTRSELTKDNFEEAYGKLVSQYDKPLKLQDLPKLTIVDGGAPGQQSGASGQGRLYLSKNEDAELDVHSPNAREARQQAMRSDTISGVLALIPDMGLDLHFWGLGGHANVFGGSFLAAAGRTFSSAKNAEAANEENQASSASKTANFERRADDWIFQYNLAAHELMQNGRQILTSLLAEQIAHHEYQTIVQQIANSQEIDQFLHEKFTNEALHLWMQGEISSLYYQYYRLAFDTARKAEQTMKQELMRPELDAQTFVKFNYWDGGRKGLLAGEALHLDVKRMELAYHENNKRELELTRHVSLRQLDPVALLNLKSTGTCQVTIPEWLYDKDCPGHYLRRIKSVALSIPSVVGPYTAVSCTLSLLASSVRRTPIGDTYARQGTGDDRFIDYGGAIQTVVTSSGHNDSGLFETNLHEERFLPFEGAGAVSTWKLDLPADYRAFDYATISDVIFHIRYTARPGVEKSKVKQSLDALLQDASAASLAMLFSLPNDFPTEWSAFVNGAGPISVAIRRDYFPYFTTSKAITIQELRLYGEDLTTHPVGDLGAATDALGAEGAFTLTLDPDVAAPLVLTRPPRGPVFLVVKYSL